MSDSNLSSNPFAALFGSVEQAQQFCNEYREKDIPGLSALNEEPPELKAQNVAKINTLIENIFLLTMDPEPFPDRPPRCVFLDELKTSLHGQEWLDLECLEQAVFERIMLPDPTSNLITTGYAAPNQSAAAVVANPLMYLFLCFKRLQSYKHKENLPEASAKCESVILMNAKTCFQHPEFFSDLDAAKEFLDIFMDHMNTRDDMVMMQFFDQVASEINSNQEDGTVAEAFQPVFDKLKEKFQKEFSLGHGVVYDYLDLLMFFTRNSCLAQALVKHNTPRDQSNGRNFENTIFGAILSISSIVKNEQGPYDFFDRPSRYSKKEHDITELSIHQPIGILNERMHQLFKAILKAGPEPKGLLLEWLGSCMLANKGRAKMWSRHMVPGMFNQMYCSDGFFINLCSVLLRLCKPFSEPCEPKLLKVQPTYCLATEGGPQQAKNRNVHLRDVKETGLIPAEEGRENEQPKMDSSYNFLTECFFMGHYALHLGFHSAHERFMKLNQDLHRIQGVYNDIVGQGGQNSEPGTRVKDQMEKGMTIFLCLKAALTEPKLLESCFDFHVATTTYLVHMATSCDHSTFRDVQLPLSDDVPQVLTAIPEFVVENILDFMLFVCRFSDSLYESMGAEKMQHLMNFILVFMGSPNRMRNPHLRARMAEALEAIMPPQNEQGRNLINYQREKLFQSHPLSEHLSETLLHVFVSIEMTGQGVEFEQKFNYRRPMYSILEYLWQVDRHRNKIKELAQHAEVHIADVQAPLFLRFINLLINDATFLLDEALDYMAQIKKKQDEKDSGEWNNLDARARQETEGNFRQLSMLARFHNMMGNSTIKTLEMLTSDIKTIFYDEVLVERMAAMLNNHLLCLVGPKSKNLKVKDFDQFEFRPDRTVSHISQIYLNLTENSEKFKQAVAHEERSYSDALFIKAKEVLVKIHRPMDSIVKFEELGEELKELVKQKEEEDVLVSEAPEEFLDPIMGTFMRQPVKLPSSGQVVDRATIARHILSDQFDPFNRQPLTMDMVEPDVELQTKINTWLAEWREKRRDKVPE